MKIVAAQPLDLAIGVGIVVVKPGFRVSVASRMVRNDAERRVGGFCGGKVKVWSLLDEGEVTYWEAWSSCGQR